MELNFLCCALIDLCPGCSSFQPSHSNECWLWWENHNLGCKLSVCYHNRYSRTVSFVWSYSYCVDLDMGRKAHSNIWNWTFQTGWRKILAVSYHGCCSHFLASSAVLEQIYVYLSKAEISGLKRWPSLRFFYLELREIWNLLDSEIFNKVTPFSLIGMGRQLYFLMMLVNFTSWVQAKASPKRMQSMIRYWRCNNLLIM